MKRNLILGFCANYTLDKIESFLASALNSAPSAQLCLFTSGMEEKFYLMAASRGIRVEDATAFATPESHPLNYRYFAYRAYLRAHGAEYGQVLLTDVRDVFFQADPFAARHPHGVCFALEDTKIMWETLNQSWIRDIYGEEILQSIAENHVSCAGTTLGSAAGIERYLDLLCAELDVRNFDRKTNYDQGIHNYIVWKLRPSWGWVDTADFIVNTVGCTSADRIAIVDDLVVIDGKVSPVVHQWDRHAVLQKHIEECARFRL